MSGLILLFALFLYAALVYWVATRFKRAWVRWVIVLLAVFGPFVEGTIARFRVASLCRAEFGVHFLRPVTDLDGLYVDGPFAAFAFGDLLRLDVDYLEYRRGDGSGYERLSIGPGGEELREVIAKPTARYELRDLEPVLLPGNVSQNEIQLIDRRFAEVVASGREFTYRGDWFVRLVRASKLPAGKTFDCGESVTVESLIAPAHEARKVLTTGVPK